MSSLAQQALDTANNLESAIANGQVSSEKWVLEQLCAGLQLLAQHVLGVTPTSDPLGSLDTTDVPATSAVQQPQL